MKQTKIQSIVAESVQKVLKESRMKQIRRIVEQEVKAQLAEADNDNKKTDSNERRTVLNALRNGPYNHADLMRKLYHPKTQSEEDTGRSLFSKKVTGKPDADGNVHQFSDKDISKLSHELKL